MGKAFLSRSTCKISTFKSSKRSTLTTTHAVLMFGKNVDFTHLSTDLNLPHSTAALYIDTYVQRIPASILSQLPAAFMPPCFSE
jgi:hypothetical protein